MTSKIEIANYYFSCKVKEGHVQRYSDIVCGGYAQANAKFLLTLTFKNGFVGDIACSSKEGNFTKIPLVLF